MVEQGRNIGIRIYITGHVLYVGRWSAGELGLPRFRIELTTFFVALMLISIDIFIIKQIKMKKILTQLLY